MKEVSEDVLVTRPSFNSSSESISSNPVGVLEEAGTRGPCSLERPRGRVPDYGPCVGQRGSSAWFGGEALPFVAHTVPVLHIARRLCRGSAQLLYTQRLSASAPASRLRMRATPSSSSTTRLSDRSQVACNHLFIGRRSLQTLPAHFMCYCGLYGGVTVS